MNESNADSIESTNKWRHFRFSLKWLLLVVAIFCVWLGFYNVRSRRAQELTALNDAIVTAIEDNVRNLPPYARFDSGFRHKHDLAAMLKQTEQGRSIQQSNIFLGGGGLYGTNIVSVELEMSRALDVHARDKVVADLLSHYEAGLAEIGLKRATGIGIGTRFDLDSRAAIWQIPEKGVTVIIDVGLSLRTKTAGIRVVLVQNQKLSVW